MNTKNTGPSSTLASSLALKIQTDIIEGVFLPGERLRTSVLGKRYDASLVPIREALSRLVSTGFVMVEDQRGFWVAEVSKKELIDITDVRIFIESEALRRSLKYGDLNWESNLIAAHHQLKRINMTSSKQSGLDPEWEKAHTHFHDSLLSGCNSPSLKSIYTTLRDQTSRYRHISVQAPDGKGKDSAGHSAKGRNVAEEHQELLEAALNRDTDLAVRLLSRHFNKTTELVMEHVNKDDHLSKVA